MNLGPLLIIKAALGKCLFQVHKQNEKCICLGFIVDIQNVQLQHNEKVGKQQQDQNIFVNPKVIS